MCQQHMKHWCNNVDWSLESVFLNINNMREIDSTKYPKIHIYGAKMFIKRDKILGKFKKGPPHIGEYERKVHFGGGRSPMVKQQRRAHTIRT